MAGVLLLPKRTHILWSMQSLRLLPLFVDILSVAIVGLK